LEDSSNDFSSSGFYGNLAKGEFKVLSCKSCGKYIMPPTSVCNNCLSTELQWVKLSERGKIVTFSEIFVSNKRFQKRTPYVVCIIETQEGVRLPGIIKNTTATELRVGDIVSIVVEPDKSAEVPAYFFNLAK
jgi:uncharacterized OB-fold protein